MIKTEEPFMIEAHVFSDASRVPKEQPVILKEGESPQEFLARHYDKGCIFGLDNLKRSGFYKVHGWAFDFRPYMKRYVVKQYGHWEEKWAPSKSLARRSTYGRVDRIVEI